MLTSDSILKTRNRVHRCRFAQVCYPSRRRGSPLEKSRLFGICGNGQIAARGLGSCVERVCERSPREMLIAFAISTPKNFTVSVYRSELYRVLPGPVSTNVRQITIPSKL